MARMETYKSTRARLSVMTVDELLEMLQRVVDELDERDVLEQGE